MPANQGQHGPSLWNRNCLFTENWTVGKGTTWKIHSKELKWQSHWNGQAPEETPTGSMVAGGHLEPLIARGWSYCGIL